MAYSPLSAANRLANGFSEHAENGESPSRPQRSWWPAQALAGGGLQLHPAKIVEMSASPFSNSEQDEVEVEELTSLLLGEACDGAASPAAAPGGACTQQQQGLHLNEYNPIRTELAKPDDDTHLAALLHAAERGGGTPQHAQHAAAAKDIGVDGGAWGAGEAGAAVPASWPMDVDSEGEDTALVSARGCGAQHAQQDRKSVV